MSSTKEKKKLTKPDPAPHRIRVALFELDRNQAWLAGKIGVSQMTVSRWIRREKPIPKQRRGAIARALGKPVAKLFD